MTKQYRYVFGANNKLYLQILSAMRVFKGVLEETVTINSHCKVYTIAFPSTKERQGFRQSIPDLTTHSA